MNMTQLHIALRLLALATALSFVTSSRAQFVTEKTSDSTSNAEVEEQVMVLSITEGNTKQLMKADVIIKGLNPRRPVIFKGISDTSFIFKNYRLYTISVIEKGYMYYAHKFWPKETTVHNERIVLQPLKVGLKTDIEDITFLGDQTDIYHKSVPALEELLEFLSLNPEVKIRVIGHANGPESEKKGAGFYKKGSEKRAEAVRDYLIQHGITADRLSTRGAGNTEMIYPNPATDWETQANRRIQIEVIGL